jgi:hypothetical protein
MRQDKKVLLISIGVSFVLTFLVWFFDDILNLVPNVYLAPDTGASHYFWKLTPDDVTLATRLSVWGFYLIHQFLSFYLVYKLSKQKVSSTLSKTNWILLSVTFGFTIIHMIQTYIWYDGLAQDVSVFSSQGSVIVMLVLILIMGNMRRGLFFGKKIKLPKGGQNRVMKHHGIFITWAIIYTFWYHPVVSTPGHLFGFFYMFLLMLQMSFAGTTVHMNRIWGLVLEVTVFFHGTTVAILQGNGMWPMFAFGFAFIFVFTQVHSLRLKKWMYLLILAIYFIAAFIVYNNVTGVQPLSMIHQITWIPIIEYGLVFAIIYLLSIPDLFKKTSA